MTGLSWLLAIILSGVIIGLVRGWMVHVHALTAAASTGSPLPPGTFCQKVVTEAATAATGTILLGVAILEAAHTLMRW